MAENILIVHNYYKIAGGEDVVVANEKQLLETHGHKVILYTRDNKELDSMNPLRKLGLFFTSIFNPRTYREIDEIIRREKIQIVHVHNTLNLISPAVYYAAKKNGIPVVNTIHNFRLMCPGAILYRNGSICEECISKGLGCALKGKCYRNSLAQTFVCVLILLFHRFTGIYRKVNFICLTQFNKDKLLSINCGKKKNIIDPDKVFIKPNYMWKSSKQILSSTEREDYILYAGRLDESKGIDILLEALAQCKVKIVIAGSGPLEDRVKKAVDKNCAKAEYVGMLGRDAVLEKMAKAKAVVIPTRWYEGFPMSIVESYSVGTPVIGPSMGNVGELVGDGKTGFLFEAGNVKDLVRVLNKFADDGASQEMYDGAYNVYADKYTDEPNYKMLMDIYRALR